MVLPDWRISRTCPRDKRTQEGLKPLPIISRRFPISRGRRGPRICVASRESATIASQGPADYPRSVIDESARFVCPARMRGTDRRSPGAARNAVEPRRGNGRETSEKRLTNRRSFSRFCISFEDAQSEAPINPRLAKIRGSCRKRVRAQRAAWFHESRLRSTQRPLLADCNA